MEKMARSPDEIWADLRNIRRLLKRFQETGDMKRLARLKGRLEQLLAEIKDRDEAISEMEKVMPRFRHSHSYDFFMERLAVGKLRGRANLIGFMSHSSSQAGHQSRAKPSR
jgi:hypothetical protein